MTAAAVMTLGGASIASAGSREPYRDASGLLVVPATAAVVPEALRDVYGTAELLGTENPDDFSVPAVNGDRLVLGTIGAAAGALASATTSDARRDALDAYLAARAAVPPSDPTVEAGKLIAPRMSAATRSAFLAATTFVTGLPSRTQTFALSDAVLDLQLDPRFADAQVWQSEVDPLDGCVIVTVATLTPVLAQDLVSTYGVDAVHVRIGRLPDSMPVGG